MGKKRQYAKEAIDKAIKYVTEEQGTIRAAAKLFGVPRSSIQFKLKNSETKFKSGPDPVLTYDEESTLEDFIILLAKRGFPRKKEDIQTCVQDFLKANPRNNPFVNNRPGDAWFNAFLKRHPRLSVRTSEGVTNASACVSEKDIRKWFKEIREYIEGEELTEVIQDPTRVFNADETGFNICPKTGKVLAEKGSKNVYEVEKGSAKDNITVMFCFSAAGYTCNPMIIYPYKRVPERIVESVPAGWGIGRSETGWMTAAVFYEYIVNVFYRDLMANNIQFPVILFVDGHRTHITIEVSELCKNLKIHLIALYPNATRILQPADVAAFRPIKSGWKKGLRDWYNANNYQVNLTKLNFAPLLKTVLDSTVKESTLVHGFRVSGLFPFNENNVDYSKCLSSGNDEQTQVMIEKTPTNCLKSMTYEDFCEIVGTEIINKCYSIAESSFVTEDNYLHTIYRLWKKIHEPSSTLPLTLSDNLDSRIDSVELQEPLKNEDCVEAEKNSNHIILDETTGELKSAETVFCEPINTFQDTVLTHPKENADKSTEAKTLSMNLLPPQCSNESDKEQNHTNVSEAKKIRVLSNEPLSEYLKRTMWPQSPKRKGKREIERLPFAMTSDSYLQIMKEKKQKKINEELEKENRKRLREENKLKKQKKPAVKKPKITKDAKLQRKSPNIKEETITSPPLSEVTVNAKEEIQLTPLSPHLSAKNSKISICYACSGYIKKKVLECNECLRQFHSKCIPSHHRDHIPTDEGDDFLCHLCYRISGLTTPDADDDNASSNDELYKFLQNEAFRQGF